MWTKKADCSKNTRFQIWKIVIKLGNVGETPFENHAKGKLTNALRKNIHVFFIRSTFEGTEAENF